MVQFKRNQHDLIIEILTHAEDITFKRAEGYYLFPSGAKLYFEYKSGHYNYNFK